MSMIPPKKKYPPFTREWCEEMAKQEPDCDITAGIGDADLIAKLKSDGSTGADLSPGDPVSRAAADLIAKLQAENAKYREWRALDVDEKAYMHKQITDLREVLRGLLPIAVFTNETEHLYDRARALLAEGK
jgi:hypothetical protein